MLSNELRHAVAPVVRRDDGLVLAVRRPDEPGEELPGVWGLPATTLRDGESPEDGVRRIGREKLGVELTPTRALAEGKQQRPGYTLRMTVYETSMVGEPRLPARQAGQPAVPAGAPPAQGASSTLYDALDWLPAESFREAAARGSLCCELLVETLTPGPSPASGRGENRAAAGSGRDGPRRPKIPPRLRQALAASARSLRRESTKSEDLLWQALRDRRLQGRKFRRQHRIGSFIVDFYCAEEQLVIEVDGSVHEGREEEDQLRQSHLEDRGLRVLRIGAGEVERNLQAALRKIRTAIARQQRLPLSRSRERGDRRSG